MTELSAKIGEGKPMSDRTRLRVVATHDFCCAYLPSTTSYGSLPGGEGLKKSGFPLLCANALEAGLPPTAGVETGEGFVGFVGLTCLDPASTSPPLASTLTSPLNLR